MPTIAAEPDTGAIAEEQPVGDAAAPEAADALEGRKDLQDALKGLVKHFAKQDKMVRRLEVIAAAQQRFYDKGYQHIWWNEALGIFALASGSSVAGVEDDASTGMPHYMEDYNIYGPYGRISSSVLTQNPPGVNFEPNDPSKAVDIEAAKAAETYRAVIDRSICRKKIQADVARLFWTDGRVVTHAHTRRNESGPEPEKTVPAVEVYGVLEAKVPVTARCQAEFAYVILSKDIEINMAKEQFPDAADNITAGPSGIGETAYERYARLGALQGTSRRFQPGDAYQHLVTKHLVWLRPAAFRQLADEYQDEFRELFPHGCHATFIGDTYCGSVDEDMDGCIAVAHPKPGDGMNRPSLGKDGVALQDAVNDYKNQEKEYYDYGIPALWVNQEVIDAPGVREQISQPGNRYPVPLGGRVQSMAQNFFAEPPASCPPGLVAAYQDMRGAFAQFVLSAPPAIFGGSDPHNETAQGIGLLRDQAMGQAGLPWSAIQELFSRVYEQLVRLIASADSDEEVAVAAGAGKAGVLQVAIADMARGEFHCTPDADSNFPETWASRRATYMSLAGEAAANPVIASILEQPDNQELARELLGLPELVIPGAESRNKQLQEIDILVRTEPIPAPPASQPGMGAAPQPPAPPQPSVGIDPIFDDHQVEFEKVQEWLNSQDRRDEDAAGNQIGVENVRLHGLLHFAELQKKAPSGPPPKPPSDSLSVNFKDLPPEAQAQALAKIGIQAPPPQAAPPQGAPNA